MIGKLRDSRRASREKEASQPRDYCVATRRFARLAQIPFDFAQGRLSLRKERLLAMTAGLSREP
jgi:hypothetical protein